MKFKVKPGIKSNNFFLPLSNRISFIKQHGIIIMACKIAIKSVFPDTHTPVAFCKMFTGSAFLEMCTAHCHVITPRVQRWRHHALIARVYLFREDVSHFVRGFSADVS